MSRMSARARYAFEMAFQRCLDFGLFPSPSEMQRQLGQPVTANLSDHATSIRRRLMFYNHVKYMRKVHGSYEVVLNDVDQHWAEIEKRQEDGSSE